MTERITRAGVFDIDITRYHHDPELCDAPSISSSGLRTLLLECPARYFAFSPYNPNKFEDETTKALDIGRAAHCLVLGEPEFNRHFYICPHDRLNEGEGYKWNKSWKGEIDAGREKRTLIRKKDFETIEVLAAVQRRSAQVMRAFEDGKPEQSLLWKDKTTGIWCRSRPDWLPNEPAKRFITEFKSCVSIEPTKLSNDVFKYGYEMQVAMMVDGVREVLGVEPLGVCLVCQEKEPPYLAELRLFTEEQIADGRTLYRRALEIFARCLKANEWPSYTQEPTYFSTPYSHAKMMEDIRHEPDRFAAPPDRSRNYNAADYLSNG